jgi:IS5 family transposase
VLDHAAELKTISELLDRVPEIYELAWGDLRRAKCAAFEMVGAKGLSAEQVVRALIVKQMNGFSYRELAFHLEDSRTYRTFCKLGRGTATPRKSSLAASIKSLRPGTLEAIHRLVVEQAMRCGVDGGKKLRVDATVVESNIHHPTDSELLWDCVRVLTRLVKRAQKLLGKAKVPASDHTRRAKKRRREINSAHRKAKRIKPFLGVTRTVCRDSRAAVAALEGTKEPHALRLAEELKRYLERTDQVVDQTRRRVLEAESVPASEKLVSIFEEHTDIIRKSNRETHYGHKICLSAGASSLVFDCRVLEGNPADATLAKSMIERHIDARGEAPRQVSFDGAFASKQNLADIKEAGVEDVVFAKGRGLNVSDMAKSTWVFRALRNFRAGIEGIISFLKRVFGLDRCTWRSRPSFESYVWSSVITSNLLVTARHVLNTA